MSDTADSDQEREPGRVLRVLVVEDDPDVRLLLHTYLNLDDRLQVCGEAADGQQALDLMGAGRFDVVVLDLNLPVVDGLTILPKLRSRHPRMAIVVYSAHVASVLTERTVLRLGADAVAAKWMPLDRLVTTICEAAASRSLAEGGLRHQT
ncbi:MAG TPA: response regulator transcription factor [Acidimicrobiales bacterium]|nr:response regulator transcription factor [Acidimicrobiales bacterium]